MEIKYYFTYGDIDSRELGLKVATLPTVIPPIKKRTEREVFTIDGKDFQFSDAYTERKISIPFKLIGTYNQQTINKISQIFTKNESKLTFSWDPDVYYIATPENGEIDEIFMNHGEGIIDFICKPYKFLLSGEAFRPLADGITNEYLESKPVIRFKGTGNITLTFGKFNMIFNSLPNQTDWIYVDSSLHQVYLENGTILSHHLDLTSDFPVIMPGFNDFSNEGNVSIIEIKPNWRAI